jgi:hypothetical protein
MLKNISFNSIFLVDQIFFDDPNFLGESILKKKELAGQKNRNRVKESAIL